MIDNELKKNTYGGEGNKNGSILLWIDLVLGDLKTTLSEIQHNYSTALKQNETNLATKHAPYGKFMQTHVPKSIL